MRAIRTKGWRSRIGDIPLPFVQSQRLTPPPAMIISTSLRNNALDKLQPHGRLGHSAYSHSLAATCSSAQLIFSLSLESHLNSATKVLGDLLTSPKKHPAVLPSGRRMTQTLMGLPVLPSHDPLGVSNSPFLQNV